MTEFKIVGADELRTLLDWQSLIAAIEEMFRGRCEMPKRHHHDIEVPGSDDATLILMPAWVPGGHMGVKIVDVFPGNARAGLAAVNATYMLFSGTTGETLAMIDGGELTARRTAATSVLAARRLARADAGRILIVGTGRMAGNLARAYGSDRPAATIAIWGRSAEKAGALADRLAAEGIPTAAVRDLEAAVRDADIVSTATLSASPLVKGAWLKPGAHLDLVGGYTPAMREADDEAVRRASVFVDTRAGAMSEAGDIAAPLANGTLTREAVLADLFDLARGAHPGRTSADEITLFKSVGAALEDLAAAVLAYRRAGEGG